MPEVSEPTVRCLPAVVVVQSEGNVSMTGDQRAAFVCVCC